MPLTTSNTRELIEAGCQMADPPVIFHMLFVRTHGEVCLTGCGYFEDGKCPAYQKFHTQPKHEAMLRAAEKVKNSTDQSGLIGGKWKGMSIKQIAESEGISLNKARERKKEGHYKQ